MNEIRTGRALQLEGLQHARNKVTIGFKCDAGTKIQLAQEAQQIGMTLSEYVDTVIATRNEKAAKASPVQKGQNYPELTKKLETQTEQINTLTSKVAFYENDFLRSSFQQYKGQQLDYVDAQGRNQSIQIQRIEDVYTILLSTVKTK